MSTRTFSTLHSPNFSTSVCRWLWVSIVFVLPSSCHDLFSLPTILLGLFPGGADLLTHTYTHTYIHKGTHSPLEPSTCGVPGRWITLYRQTRHIRPPQTGPFYWNRTSDYLIIPGGVPRHCRRLVLLLITPDVYTSGQRLECGGRHKHLVGVGQQ